MNELNIVVLDSCVIFPAPLRDLLVQLAATGMFRAHWTPMIHEEWIRNVLATRPELSRHKLERTRELMDTHADGALVTGFEPLIAGLSLPDPDDRHVLAAAMTCKAGVIVTFNTKDFPPAILAAHGVVPQHPDEFLDQLIALDRVGVCAALKTVRARLRNPPMSAGDYLDRLEKQGLIRSVATMRSYVGLI